MGKISLNILMAVVCCACMLCGCVSQNPRIDVSRYLKQYEEEQAEPDGPSRRGPDAPDAPISALPPLDAATMVGVTSAGGSITIQPDSVLQISVEEDPSLDGSYPVNSIGAIDFGYIGPIFLYNKTEKQAERKIESVLKGRDFRRATVNARIVRASYDSVKVTGAVVHPQLVRIGAGDGISLNDLLLRAGGVRGSVLRARVKVVRNGRLSAVASALEGEEYSLVSEDGSPSVPDVFLQNNDVAYVYADPVKGAGGSVGSDESQMVGQKEILLLGEVKRRGPVRFGWSEPCTMMHLIFKIGGLPPYANTKAVAVVRRNAAGLDESFVINVKKLLEDGNPDDDFALEDGDRVVVPARRFSIF